MCYKRLNLLLSGLIFTAALLPSCSLNQNEPTATSELGQTGVSLLGQTGTSILPLTGTSSPISTATPFLIPTETVIDWEIPTATSYPIPTETVIERDVPTATPNQIPAETTIEWEILGQVNYDRVVTDLRRLTGEEPICTINGCYTIKNRETGSDGLQWAKDYIYEELVQLGYSVVLHDWSDSGYSDQNLIARKPGIISPEEEIYFIAHIDGVPPDGVQRSPAADDNASGVVDLLEVARVLSSHAFHKTVVLLFTTGEEHGALGTWSYVDQLTPDELSRIKYVVNVDMIGYDSNNDGLMQLWPGDQPLDFVQTLNDIIIANQLNLVPKIISDCY